jgi:hypothetical protein
MNLSATHEGEPSYIRAIVGSFSFSCCGGVGIPTLRPRPPHPQADRQGRPYYIRTLIGSFSFSSWYITLSFLISPQQFGSQRACKASWPRGIVGPTLAVGLGRRVGWRSAWGRGGWAWQWGQSEFRKEFGDCNVGGMIRTVLSNGKGNQRGCELTIMVGRGRIL